MQSELMRRNGRLHNCFNLVLLYFGSILIGIFLEIFISDIGDSVDLDSTLYYVIFLKKNYDWIWIFIKGLCSFFFFCKKTSDVIKT